jgi:hypothetical protein
VTAARRWAAAVVVVVAASSSWATAGRPAAAEDPQPRQCALRTSDAQLCLQWEDPPPDAPHTAGGPGPAPVPDDCEVQGGHWVTVPADQWDGLPENAPPPGATVQHCDGATGPGFFQWALPAAAAPNAADVAQGLIGRLQTEIGTPEVSTTPAGGHEALVNTPVFFRVDNWPDGGTIEVGTCQGVCVKITAKPSIVVHSGVPGAQDVTCAGPGILYDPNTAGDAARPETQAQWPGRCTVSYGLRTGMPGRPAAWPTTVEVVWTATWAADDGTLGTFDPIRVTADAPRPVFEVVAVGVAGGSQ